MKKHLLTVLVASLLTFGLLLAACDSSSSSGGGGGGGTWSNSYDIMTFAVYPEDFNASISDIAGINSPGDLMTATIAVLEPLIEELAYISGMEGMFRDEYCSEDETLETIKTWLNVFESEGFVDTGDVNKILAKLDAQGFVVYGKNVIIESDNFVGIVAIMNSDLD